MPVKIKCQTCGKTFLVRPYQAKTAKYCSRECRDQRIEIKCLTCGKTFKVSPSVIKNGKGKYCSKECVSKSRKKRITKKCESCGKTFEVTPTYGQRKYCSRECYHKSRYKRVKVKCKREGCNNTFEVTPGKLNKGEGKYCSKECFILDLKGKKLNNSNKISKPKKPNKICPICKKPFVGRKNQKYCSYECSGKAVSQRWKDPSYNPRKRSLDYKHGDEIVDLYLNKKKSTPEIAEIFKCNDESIRAILHKRDVKIRSRSEYSKLIWSKDDMKEKISTAIKNAHLNDPNIAKKISKSTRGPRPGIRAENNPNWRGGVSFEPYCPKFNNEFKERVREFWGRKCGICGKTGKEYGKKLHVHHVNYEKMACCDNTPPLFIPLCNSCHTKTNFNRTWWEHNLTEYIMKWYNGDSYLSKV